LFALNRIVAEHQDRTAHVANFIFTLCVVKLYFRIARRKLSHGLRHPADRRCQTLMDDKEKQQNFIDRTPLRRWGQPNEISGAAVFLASDAGSYATGSVIVLDGGSTA